MEESTVIKKTIPFQRMCNAVRDIVDLLFDDQDGYCPENLDYVFWVTISNAYANTGAEMSADAFMRKLYETGWMDDLTLNINPHQLSAIRMAVDARVKVRLEKNPMESLANGILQLINDLDSLIKNHDTAQMMETLKGIKEINAEELVKAFIDNQNK